MPARDPGFVAKPPRRAKCAAGCGAELPAWHVGKCAACADAALFAPPRCPDCGEHGGKNRPTDCTNTYFHVAGIGGIR